MQDAVKGHTLILGLNYKDASLILFFLVVLKFIIPKIK